MRAGPLSDTTIQARLDEDFVTSWMLAKDLPRIARDASDVRVRELAAAAHASYEYPVDSQVWSPERKLLAQVGANSLFDEGARRYHELLDAAAPRR